MKLKTPGSLLTNVLGLLAGGYCGNSSTPSASAAWPKPRRFSSAACFSETRAALRQFSSRPRSARDSKAQPSQRLFNGLGTCRAPPVCFPSDPYLRSCTLTKPNVAPFGFGKSRVGSAYAKARRVSRRRLSRGVWDEAGLLQGMDRSSAGNGTPVVQPPQEKQWRRGRRWGKRHA